MTLKDFQNFRKDLRKDIQAAVQEEWTDILGTVVVVAVLILGAAWVAWALG